MTVKEWESLCCRCGICCLNRRYGRKPGEVFFTLIACKYLDTETCHCRIYEDRFKIVRECEKITADNVLKITWLPKTCGYRTVAEGRDLEWWHPLVSGSLDTVHRAGISIKNKGIISENDLIVGDLLRYLIKRPAKL